MNRTSSERVSPVFREWRTYRRLLEFVRPYRARLIVGLLCGVLFSAANGAFVWVIKGGMRGAFLEHGLADGRLLLVSILLFPVVGVLRGVADVLTTYLIRWVGHHVVMDMRNAMFRHIHDLSVDYFSQSRTGELISRTANDTMLVERAVSTVLADLAKQPLTLAFMMVWIFVVDFKLAAVSLVLMPLCLIPIAAFGRRVRRHSRAAQERVADFVSILQETISGVRIVKAFGMEQYEVGRFSAQTQAFFKRTMRVVKANALMEPIIVFLATLGIALLLVYVRAVKMPVPEFFAFAAAYFMMYEPVKKLSKIHIAVQQSSAAADRIFEILDTESAVRDEPGASALKEEIREVAFDDVVFEYEAGPRVLDGIRFRVKSGERLALVGSSGAGKTTLVNLVPRFYDVTAGAILINGRDVRRYTLGSLRNRIGLVTQETFLFNDTVANNISYGVSEAARGAVEEAARRAHAHEFIAAMPQGYETLIGERGVRLSGGQRQRLAIARAILRDPPILILDEATSALDTESERMVQAALNTLMRGRTVFAIAHRLSTITNCDRIIVLDRGRIVEEGTHTDLLALGGTYRRLYDLQFEDAPESRAGP